MVYVNCDRYKWVIKVKTDILVKRVTKKEIILKHLFYN